MESEVTSQPEYTIKHAKPKAFYDEFHRKGPGDRTTHYCPGCGHGTAHKLIAEVIDQLGIQDRTIFCSPVGCSVFAYYYMDCGNIQCAHGRAPAVATGLRRTLEDAIIISYQGDGDLAGIGLGAVTHAANRGENITVFFVNNAIYGMTGGQMAPTTLIDQKTETSPYGRSVENEGFPIGMAEVMSSLKAPVFVERVSLADGRRILKARKAIHTAIKNQVDRKGFSFVEILSACPVNWKMSPSQAQDWIKENLEEVFPVKNFRDESADRPPTSLPRQYEPTDKQLIELLSSSQSAEIEGDKGKDIQDQYVKIAGFGGQGVVSAGVFLANCAIEENLYATWLPSYGSEMRGGTANASIIVSAEPIGSPVVDPPNVLLAMNQPSLNTFARGMEPGSLILANTSLIESVPDREDVTIVSVPATDIAHECGLVVAAPVAMLTVYAMLTDVIDIEVMRMLIPAVLKKKEHIDVNLCVIDRAADYCLSHITPERVTLR